MPRRTRGSSRNCGSSSSGSGCPSGSNSRNLRGGDKLLPEIRKAIEQARQVIGVFSPQTVNSGWVRREIQWAERVAKRRQGDGYAVIPVLLPGIEPAALGLWFKDEPAGVKVQLGPGGLTAAAPLLAAALGVQLPDDFEPPAEVPAAPSKKLRLKLVDPVIETAEGQTLVKATAVVHYDPADPTARHVESRASRSPRRWDRSNGTTSAGTWRVSPLARRPVRHAGPTDRRQAPRVGAAPVRRGPRPGCCPRGSDGLATCRGRRPAPLLNRGR